MKQKIVSDVHNSLFSIEHVYEQPTLCRATVVLSKDLIKSFFNETVRTLRTNVQAHGFAPGAVPTEYIIQQYTSYIIDHLKEFFLKFAVINFLLQEIYLQKILVAGDPRLIDISLDLESDARFSFELSVFPEIALHDWKYFLFKAPHRKNYKDLDRQVESFIDEEQKLLQEYTHDHIISIGDWLAFDIAVVDNTNNALDDNFTQKFWLKIGDEEVESPLRAVFIGKKNGDTFTITNKGLQDYFSDQLCGYYHFLITITAVIPHHYFCFELFKHHFKVKTNKDMHKKLIEVFSYRNDISQRLSMVEDAFKLLLSKHRFLAPNHLVLRQQKIILSAIQKNPDYNVYRKQKDFQLWVTQLAEKQVKEALFIDQLAYNENLEIIVEDLTSYLNFDKRARMKEFIYFNLPETKRDGQEMPLAMHELHKICLREKAINHAIYHLTKK